MKKKFGQKTKSAFAACAVLLLLSTQIYRAKSDLDASKNNLVLTLPKVVEYVQKQNLDVAIAEAQINQTEGLYLSSYADLMPSIRGQYSAERFEGGEIVGSNIPVSFNRTTLRPLATFDYQIQTGGKAIYGIMASKKQLARSQFARTRVLQTAFLDSLTAYYTWLRDISAVNIAKQSLFEATEQLELSENRFQDGFATKLEVSQNRTLKSERQAELLEAINQEQISQTALIALLNLPKEKKIAPESSRIVPVNFFVVEGSTVDDLMGIALKERPDLKELNLLIKEAKAKYGMARADLFPTVGLSSFVRGIGPKFSELQSSKDFMFTMNVDLLRNLGVGVFGNMKASKAKIQEAYLNKQKQFNEAFKEVSQAHKQVSLFQQKLKVAQSKVNSAEEAYEIAKFRSAEGVGINLEVIQAQTELTKAKLDYQTAASDFNNAQINLLHKLGRLTPEKVLNAQPTSEEDRCFAEEKCMNGELLAIKDDTPEVLPNTDDQKVNPAPAKDAAQNRPVDNFEKREEELTTLLLQISKENQSGKTNELSRKDMLAEEAQDAPTAVKEPKATPSDHQIQESLHTFTEKASTEPEANKVNFQQLSDVTPQEKTNSKPEATPKTQEPVAKKTKAKRPFIVKRLWMRLKSFYSRYF